MICPNCKKEIDSSKFCKFCGEKIKKDNRQSTSPKKNRKIKTSLKVSFFFWIITALLFYFATTGISANIIFFLAGFIAMCFPGIVIGLIIAYIIKCITINGSMTWTTIFIVASCYNLLGLYGSFLD